MELDDENELIHEEPGMKIYSEDGKAVMYIINISGNMDVVGAFKNKLAALNYYRIEFS